MPDSAASTIRQRFPMTRWSLILEARVDPDLREQAVRQLLQDYWQPLYCYARRSGCTRETAEDLVQDFGTRLLEHDLLSEVDPSRGHLRKYFKRALRNYDSQAPPKCNETGEFATLNYAAGETALAHTPSGPDEAFDHEWALVVLERCLNRLTDEFTSGERAGQIEVVLELFGFGDAPSYVELAERHGMTAVHVKSFVHIARRRFRAMFHEELRDTMGADVDVEEAARELLECLK